MTNSKIVGIEQGRAKAAYDFVKSVNDSKVEKLMKKYKSGVKKLPVLIKTNGLGQSLAFIKGRDEGWDKIYEQLTKWLQEKTLVSVGSIELVEKVIEMDSYTYRQISLECITFLLWMRRFVDGLMKDVKEE